MASVHQKSTLLLFMLASATIIAILFSWQNGIQIPKATAVTASAGIGVYWDPASTNSCQSISWGQLTPGAKKTMVLYLKNEGTDSIYYLLTTEQWYPTNTSSYITLQWDYNGTRATSGSVRRVSLTLLVSQRISGIVNFNFYIVIMGSPYLWGDINHDGKVDTRDLAIVAKAYGSYLGSPNWNADADINGDGRVDIRDISITAKNFGKTST